MILVEFVFGKIDNPLFYLCTTKVWFPKDYFSSTLRFSLQACLAVCILLVYAHSHELLLGARLIVVGHRLGIAPLNAASCLVNDLFPGYELGSK